MTFATGALRAVSIAVILTFALSGCSTNPNAKTVSQAYINGMNVNRNVTAQDIDMAGGTDNYCSVYRQVLTPLTTDQDQKDFQQGCHDFVYKKLDMKQTPEQGKAKDSIVNLLQQLKSRSKTAWRVGHQPLGDVPGGYRTEFSAGHCLLMEFAHQDDVELADATDYFTNLGDYRYALIGKGKFGSYSYATFFKNSDDACTLDMLNTLKIKGLSID